MHDEAFFSFLRQTPENNTKLVIKINESNCLDGLGSESLQQRWRGVGTDEMGGWQWQSCKVAVDGCTCPCRLSHVMCQVSSVKRWPKFQITPPTKAQFLNRIAGACSNCTEISTPNTNTNNPPYSTPNQFRKIKHTFRCFHVHPKSIKAMKNNPALISLAI